MMLTKNVCRGALFYNTSEALVLLQVNTVVSWQFDSAVERLAGEHKGGRVTSNFYLEGAAVQCKKLEIPFFCVCTSSVLGAVCCFDVRHNVTFYSFSPAMLYYLLEFRIFQRCSRGKNIFPSVRGKNTQISASLVLYSMHLCDSALVS